MLVESPAKAKKIQEYLGPDYQVIASYGHIRDLPAKTGSVVPEEDFSMTWELADSARPRLDAIAKAVAQSSRVVLATDPDREGEAISWHLVQELERRGVLPDPSAAQRVTFNEVTRPAVLAALAAPRELSKPLVDAYMARRALDYLFGFNLSPLLWRKLPGARSAGRVQSVALRLVAEREAAIEAFVPQPYWSVHADVALPQGGGTVRASLVAMDGGPLPDPGILEESVAQSAAERIAAAHFTVTSSTSRQVSRQPSAPFTTSTMQQEASTRLGLSAARTMQLAQKLYEAGHITYMRTDGVSMAAQAVQALRGAIEAQHGAAYLPDAPRFYASKAKNAQEAHEAIRPTNPLATPEKLHAQGFESGAVQLYRLIRARAMASQMANSKTNQVTAEFESDSGDLKLRATASHTVFPGFTAAYARAFPSNGNGEADEAQVEGDPDGNSNGNGKTERSNALQREAAAAGLAALQKGESVSIGEAAPEGHTTRGPPRFTEGTLVKSLEELGVGRPSTYAPTMKLLQARKYVHKEGRALHAEPLGRVLSAFLCAYFPTYVDYEFTSRMEAELDEVSGGQADWKGLLNRFWGPFHEAVSSKKDLSGTEVIDMLNEELSALLFDTATGSNEAAGAAESGAEGAEGAELLSNGQQTEGEASLRSGRTCPSCGNPLSLKMSHKGGPFVGCTTYPHCSYTRPVGQKMYDAVEFPDSYKSLTVAEKYGFRGPVRLLGEDPNTGSLIFIRHGQYGPYVQLGLDSDTKMRRVPLPKVNHQGFFILLSKKMHHFFMRCKTASITVGGQRQSRA